MTDDTESHERNFLHEELADELLAPIVTGAEQPNREERMFIIRLLEIMTNSIFRPEHRLKLRRNLINPLRAHYAIALRDMNDDYSDSPRIADILVAIENLRISLDSQDAEDLEPSPNFEGDEHD